MKNKISTLPWIRQYAHKVVGAKFAGRQESPPPDTPRCREALRVAYTLDVVTPSARMTAAH